MILSRRGKYMNKLINIFQSNQIIKNKGHKFYKAGINLNKIFYSFIMIKNMKNNYYKFNK